MVKKRRKSQPLIMPTNKKRTKSGMSKKQEGTKTPGI